MNFGPILLIQMGALDIVTKDTLVVVVDTHKPSLMLEEKLVHKTEHVVLIDHHRRGEEFVEDPTLVIWSHMLPQLLSSSQNC